MADDPGMNTADSHETFSATPADRAIG